MPRAPRLEYLSSRPADRPTTLPLSPPRTHNPAERAAALDANLSTFERTLEDKATNGPMDLLSLISAATRAESQPSTLIVVSSGLSTAGGFDLRQVGWDANPSLVASQLKALGLLPDLDGRQVVFSGLGDVAGRQHALPLPQQTTLESYWTAICRASGAASCRAWTRQRGRSWHHTSQTQRPLCQCPWWPAFAGLTLPASPPQCRTHCCFSSTAPFSSRPPTPFCSPLRSVPAISAS